MQLESQFIEKCIDNFKPPLNSSRIKKSSSQISLLKRNFQENKAWSKKKIEELSRLTNLKHTQVYKWYWDQRLKTQKKDNENGKNGAKYGENSNGHAKIFVSTDILIPERIHQSEEIEIRNFLK
jgi:hypothetical protein